MASEMKSSRLGQMLHTARAGAGRFAPVFAGALILYLFTCRFMAGGSENRYILCACMQAGAGWFMLFGLLGQLLREKKGLACPWLPWLTAAIGGAMGGGLFAAVLLPDPPPGSLWVTLLYGGVTLAGLAAAVFLLYADTNRDGLFAHLGKNILFTGVVCGIVTVGLTLCLLAIDQLLFPLSETTVFRLTLFPWLVLLPCLFCVQLPPIGQASPLPRGLKLALGRAALPLYLVLIGILYGYLAKILFTWHMPSGTINWFASLALAGYLFFWLALRQDTAPWVQKVLRWGWAFLLPILAVQLVGIVIRLRAYGLTTARYAGLLCLLVGVIGLVLAGLNCHPRGLFAAFAVVALVGSCTPLNIVDLPRFAQAHRLEQQMQPYGLWDGENLSLSGLENVPAETRAAMWESIRYLRYDSPCQWETPLAAAISGHSFTPAQQALFDIPGCENASAYYSLRASDILPVTGFDRAYAFSGGFGDGSAPAACQEWEDGTVLDWAPTDYLDALLSAVDPDTFTLPPDFCTVVLDDHRSLYLTHVSFDAQSQHIRDVYLQGFLLVRD